MDAHFEQDWTFLTVPSNYQWEDSSSSAGSTPRLRPSARLPSTNNNNNNSDPSLKRPRLQRRHSPEATYLLSLVHQHEPIRVPVPPSLQAKGRRLSDRTPSSTGSGSRSAWYDYNEFGLLEDGAGSPSTKNNHNTGRSSPPMSSSRSSVSALRKDPPSVLGDAYSKPYGAPGTPPRPTLVPKNIINNFPPPLSLPSPVVGSRLSPQ